MDYEKKSSLLDECRIGLKFKIRQDKESEFNCLFVFYSTNLYKYVNLL